MIFLNLFDQQQLLYSKNCKDLEMHCKRFSQKELETIRITNFLDDHEHDSFTFKTDYYELIDGVEDIIAFMVKFCHWHLFRKAPLYQLIRLIITVIELGKISNDHQIDQFNDLSQHVKIMNMVFDHYRFVLCVNNPITSTSSMSYDKSTKTVRNAEFIYAVNQEDTL